MMTATRRMAAAVAIALLCMPMSAGVASAHPLGNFTVNRALAIEIGDQVTVRAVLDLAEIPAFETIQRIDADASGDVGAAEGSAYAHDTCARWSDALTVELDGTPLDLQMRAEPALTFPAGSGGLATLRLECRFTVAPAPEDDRHDLVLRDETVNERTGWREVIALARGDAQLLASDVPAVSPSALLTAYPDAGAVGQQAVRMATVAFILGSHSEAAPVGQAAPAIRQTAADPLAALVGVSALSPAIVFIALALSLGLGALHALSPGHGKTLVAAYVVGAGATVRSAASIGLWIAVAHTTGVLALGLVTLLASQLFVPERFIAWLSLGSGLAVIGLGGVLLFRSLAMRRHGRHDHAHAGHSHGHGHSHVHGEHQHGRASDASSAMRAEPTWRSALALGFAGGVVPSASAVIVLLVAISTDRLLLGIVLIASFGIGMAAVLGGLAMVVGRIGTLAGSRVGPMSRPLVRRAAGALPSVAALVVIATGLAFTYGALAQLS